MEPGVRVEAEAETQDYQKDVKHNIQDESLEKNVLPSWRWT